jgi:hypothetical protein
MLTRHYTIHAAMKRLSVLVKNCDIDVIEGDWKLAGRARKRYHFG